MRIRDSAVQLPQFIHVVQDIYEAKGEDTDHVTGQRQQKQEEVAVVSPPDAVVHPGTVMVKATHAALTRLTVLRSHWLLLEKQETEKEEEEEFVRSPVKMI